MKDCPCFSGKPYEECCGKCHAGALPETALALMRSRYAAYAVGNADYLMDTTHPDNPAYSLDRQGWKKKILEFSKNTRFEGLTIVDFIDGKEEAFVTFTAYLKQGDHDASFTEKSRFLKITGKWLYVSGEKILL
jgi:SEC-C motif-containing protein